MKTLLLMAVCSGWVCLLASGHLLNFRDMIEKVSGHSALDYVAYGCHCGWGGIGEIKDATDRCCHTHDCCYDMVSSQECDPKIDKYSFKVADGQVTCEGDRCGLLACECDKAAVRCFKENRETYNVEYRFYHNDQCEGDKPGC